MPYLVPGINRWLEELAWVSGTPTLLDLPGLPNTLESALQSAPLDSQHPSSVSWVRHLRRRCSNSKGRHSLSTRLGPRFEALVQDLVDLCPELAIRQSNLVLRNADRTLGELDLLVDTPQGLVHVEQSVKFYLASSPHPASNRWYGTLVRDRLDLKMKQLLQKQIPRPREEAVRQQLHALKLYPDHSEALVKGRLFTSEAGNRYHCSGQALVESGAAVSADDPLLCTGFWLPDNASRKLFQYASHWTPLPRSCWMAPVHLRPEQCASKAVMTVDPEACSFSVYGSPEALDQALALRYPPQVCVMLAGLTRDSTSGGWRETQRAFLVSSEWLHKVAAEETVLNAAATEGSSCD